MKKRKPRLIVLALLCLIAMSAYVYCNYVRVQNVFDQMYYSRANTNSLFSEFTSHRYLFKDMPQIDTPPRDGDYLTIEMGNVIYEFYSSHFLEEGHTIRFAFYMTSRSLNIDYFIESGERQESYQYRYSVDEKTLTYKTSDPENLEMKNFLFTRVLPDWFAANSSKTRFSLQNLGHYTLIDTTEKMFTQ